MAQPTYTRLSGVAEAHKPFVKPLLALIDKAARGEGWREGDAFCRWMEAAARSIYGAVMRLAEQAGHAGAAERWQANEDAYMANVARCRRPQETMGLFAEAMPILIDALEAQASDFLGPIYSEVAANPGAGQFFTPWEVCRLMAKMTAGDLATQLESTRAAGGNAIFAQEPACGVGGMVLAWCQTMREEGLEPGRHAHWLMVDVDFKAVTGAYLQAALTGVSATVIHGNTLTLETWSSWPTPTAVLWPKRRPPAAVSPPPGVLVAAIPEPPPAATPAPRQLDLFDMLDDAGL